VRVKRDFDEIYATEQDPWSIGDADSDRYNLYVDGILAGSRLRGSVLELGCGYGAFLARLHGQFDRLYGIELSVRAVERGRERFPFIEFAQGSLADLDAALPRPGEFDTIVVSDVLYYLRERDRRAAMAWIAGHLARDGLAFIAGWSPGGHYLSVGEFRNLVERDLAIESEELLPSEHAVFCCRRRRTLVAMTVDYETWHPQPEGFVLDWDKDVLGPTARLLDVFDEVGATLTLFVEMGEHLWLRENRPDLAQRLEQQWREAVARGHDVQLHLHPNWLPELNPTERDGRWSWDMQRARAADYPGDLATAIQRCKNALEQAIRPVDADYEVIAYRAGTYEAQPFDRLYDALTANGVWCDSSVLPGDSRPDRQYDYAHAYSDHQPWFAARYDPQLKAPPAERGIVELPIFTPHRGQRWTFDNEEGQRFAARLLDRLRTERHRPSSEALRLQSKIRTVLNDAYVRLRRVRRSVNRLLPRRIAAFMTAYQRERLVGHRYFVLVSHTKTELDLDAIRAGLARLRQEPEVELVSISELARSARPELERNLSGGRIQEAERQVRREYAAQMSSDRNTAQALELLKLVPFDRTRILDVGCGRGLGTATLADALPRSEVVGIDVGEDFISRAREEFGTARVSFAVEDFAELSFPDGHFDCVHADNSLEHAFDIDATLAELHRVLGPGGCLVAALPADGLNPDRTCDNHTWKTIPSDVRARLRAAGFEDVQMRQIDVFRRLGMSPYPPSADQMLYVRAWKPPCDRLERIRQLTSWTYRSLDPERAQQSNDPLAILAGGYAWCWGYVVVLGEALAREGYEVSWITMVAEDHPRGIGKRRRDTHEVLEVKVEGRTAVVCDPMVGIVFESSLAQLLADPGRADVPREEDKRYQARSYALYSTSSWYQLVRRVAVRRRPGSRLRFVNAPRVMAGSRP
jgi:SAM-dependent methyltransferase